MNDNNIVTVSLDYAWEASNIIMKHTEAFMRSANYEPKTADELYDTMVEECSYLLTLDLLSKKYTPMQYNAIRNELAKQLADIFGF